MSRSSIFFLSLLFSLNTLAQGVSSPEPPESNYNRELNAANDSKARGMALTRYVDAIMEMSYSDEDKKQLIEKKVKAMIELDFMGFHEIFMKIKGTHVSFMIKQILPILTTEQRAAFNAANRYITDDFISRQNNTIRPAWPANVPQPGYGWGKR
ncbi:MAG: hypothetical protein IPI66_14140 [Chitinophagaceae bacterium]|nr:hypothetical protein [Chitinophagaceae bacterium]